MKPAHPAITHPAITRPAASGARPLAPAILASAALAALALAPAARAETVGAQVQADFNGYRSNAILSAESNDSQPHGLETGLAVADGAKDWLGGTGGPRAFAGALTPAGAPGYAITQSPGAPANTLRVYGVRTDILRQTYRNLSIPMTGVIWGSFLLRQSKTEGEDNAGAPVFQKTGLTFNIKSIDPDLPDFINRRRIYARGADLVLNGAAGAAAVTVPGVFTAGRTALVLFRHDTATRQTDLWVDPASLPSDPARLLSSSTAAYSGVLDLLGSGALVTIGVGGNYYVDASGGGGRSGDLDALRLDSSAHAYYAVTGLPVPPGFPRAPVIADFNDTAIGWLGKADSPANNNKGAGFSNVKWDGGAASAPAFSGIIYTGAEDLAAPAFTRHAIVQSGPPRCVYGFHNDIAVIRGAWRTLAAPLSGEVWGSFLVQNGKAGHRTGLFFNFAAGSGDFPVNRSIAAVGTSLVVYQHGGAKVADIPDVFTLGETALVLFRINTGTLRLTIWVNPVLPGNVAGLAALTPCYDATGIPFLGAAGAPLERIGITVTGGQTTLAGAGKLDALYLASGDTGYHAVTGLRAIAPPTVAGAGARMPAARDVRGTTALGF
ncbi:MAG: hypothetical protein LBC18_11715 [Opitutaceae bacterium]|jgi:hypothetical protein|nr:hypothetical protein [Opitutaceae bacterium]